MIIVDPCMKLKCQFNGKCYKRADNSAECICPICASDSNAKAVCGSDGKTYASDCHLKFVSCKMKRNIPLSKNEPCGKQSTFDLKLR